VEANAAANAAGAARAGDAAQYTFAVRSGCRLECNPGHCAACAMAWNEGLHPVHARIRKAYEVEAQEETAVVNIAGDAAEETAFLAGLGLLWCRHDCGDYLLTLQKCRFHGECQRCTAVNRREKEQASARNLFYEPHSEAVRQSKELVRAEWVRWLDSWVSEWAEENGVRWRQEFDQQVAEAAARRG
jgi:hypothetical protein